jgi:prepilin-type N-terminal cleavage/methylation domain-containing protein
MRADRSGFTLVESSVAVVVLVMLLYGTYAGLGTFANASRRGDVTLDVLRELSFGSETLGRDIREARQIIHPPPGALPARMLFLRNFEGQIVTYYYSANRRELRRATLGLQGLPTEDPRPPARNLDGAYFTVTDTGLVSWGFFVGETAVLGASARKNQ